MRTWIRVLTPVLALAACFGWAVAAERPDDPYYLTQSAWDEQTRGPLPRYRLGGTPEPDPDRSLEPYPVNLFSFAPVNGQIASPPEYAPADGVIYRYSSSSFASTVVDCVATLTGDPTKDEIAYVVVGSASQQSTAKAQFEAAGADITKVQFILAPNDSVWLRDYGPHFIWQDGTPAIVDSHYYPNRPLDNFIPTLLADDVFDIPSYDIGLYYSGGNFQPGPNGSGYTTSLVNQDNPGFGEPFIAELYNTYQGIDTLHIFPRLPSSVDGTGHIDMWFYLVDADTVIISEFLPGENAQAIEITNNAAVYMENLGFEVFRVPDQNAFHPQGGSNTHFTYTNAYRVNDRIFIPSYGSGNAAFNSYDAQALATWQQAAGPSVEIVPIDSYNIIWASGAIHCIMMQVPRITDPIPKATVLSPAGGDLLVSGTSYDLQWSASDDSKVTSVDLLYSTDGGSTFDGTIALGQPNVGSYTWSVPPVEEPDTVVKVIARDGPGNTVEAVTETALGVMSATRRVYDFSSGAGIDKWGYGYQTQSWSDLENARRPALASTEIDVLVTDAYSKMAASDATGGDTDPNRYRATSPSSSRETTHIFELIIDESPFLINDIEILWEGYADQCVQMELYVWDYVAGKWCDGSGQCGENRFMDNFAGNRDEELRGNIRSDFDRYIDGSGRMTLLLYGERSGQESLHDYMSVTVTSDNCPFIFNPDQTDTDFDFAGDVCDNCQGLANPGQANDDGDIFGNACDCSPADGGAYALPGEISNLRPDGEMVSFVWDSESANAGAGTTYDVLRGSATELPVGSGASESCFPAGTTEFDDMDDPAAGAGFFYLVRGTNSCGPGSYGTASDATPRETTVCP